MHDMGRGSVYLDIHRILWIFFSFLYVMEDTIKKKVDFF